MSKGGAPWIRFYQDKKESGTGQKWFLEITGKKPHHLREYENACSSGLSCHVISDECYGLLAPTPPFASNKTRFVDFHGLSHRHPKRVLKSHKKTPANERSCQNYPFSHESENGLEQEFGI